MLQTEQILQDRYQLQQQLGNNAGRQTWLVKDISTSTGELVIIKLLAFSPELQWEEFKLFEREAQVLKHLNHPCIPNYLDYFSLDKNKGEGLCWFALVQEYIPGKSLQQALESGQRFTEEQVKAIATQLLEILTYLHESESPVIHRDIKPSNIILGEDEQIYLVDFGAVQDTAAAAGATFTIVGTTGYAPLEQFWGKAVPASDLYGLGATLIHLLTGICPADLPQNNLRIQFRDQVSINPNFLRWIEALIEPNVEERVSTAKNALYRLKTGQTISHPLLTIPSVASDPFTLKKSSTNFLIILSSNPWLQFMICASKLVLFVSIGLVLLTMIIVLMAIAGAEKSYDSTWLYWVHLAILFLAFAIWILILREWVYLCKDLHYPSLRMAHLQFTKFGKYLTVKITREDKAIWQKHNIIPQHFSVEFEKPLLIFKMNSHKEFFLRTNLTFSNYQVMMRHFNQWLIDP